MYLPISEGRLTEYVGGFPDKNDDVNVIAMHRFQQEISLSTGKKAVAYMTVKESKVNGNKFYTIEVMLKKYPLQISKGLNLQRLETSETSTISCRPLNTFILSKSQNKSSKIKPDYDGHNVLHKSFDITVKDITENNKNKKVEQVQKSLNAMITLCTFRFRKVG